MDVIRFSNCYEEYDMAVSGGSKRVAASLDASERLSRRRLRDVSVISELTQTDRARCPLRVSHNPFTSSKLGVQYTEIAYIFVNCNTFSIPTASSYCSLVLFIYIRIHFINL